MNGRAVDNDTPQIFSREPLVDLKTRLRIPVGTALSFRIGAMLERILGLAAINHIYQTLPPDTTEDNFYDNVLAQLKVSYRVISRSDQPVPAEGPVLVLANHPFGGVDGLVMGAMLLRWRRDLRLMANHLLLQIPEMRSRVIPVDPFGRPDSIRSNLAGLRTCIQFLRQGGCVATFPAGEVSHWQPTLGTIADPAWSPHFTSLARRTGATVVPVYFHGRNSVFFHMLGVFHQRLRTLRLPQEVMNMQESVVTAVIGEPIPASRLAAFSDEKTATAFVRMQTMLLRGRVPQGRKRLKARSGFLWKRSAVPEPLEELAEPVSPDLLEAEINALPKESLLLAQGRFQVWVAKKAQIPNVMEEIGRARELTFRLANEGTGKRTDLDRFDEYYRHLFLWDTEARAIAGAYRLGLSTEILPSRGQKGFYVSTLFHMHPGFLEGIHPAIELGRSFIVPRYQRKHATLILLWKGVGEFVVRNPYFRYLFGPVSIDKEYQSLSKDIIVQFLTSKARDSRLAGWVRPRRRLKVKTLKRDERESVRKFLNDIDEVSALISEIEVSGKGIPTLLRHYVKLNARLLAFNIDPDFNDSVDSLMVCDVLQVDRKLLAHYFGKKGSESLLRFHGVVRQPAAPPSQA